MTGAPASNHALRMAAWRRTWDRLLREPTAAERTAPESAAPSRPLVAGAQSTQHNALASRPKDDEGAAGDDHRDFVTPTAD